MKKTVYTHLSLHRGLSLYFLLICCLNCLLVAYILPWLFGTKSTTDVKELVVISAIVYTAWLVTQVLQVIVITDDGIKSYSLLQREVFLKWDEINSYGVYKWIGFDRKKHPVPEKPFLNSLKANVYIYLSVIGKPDFRLNTMQRKAGAIRFPYRSDVYKKITDKLSN
jgi:hypothetical protein